ncbi:MAG: nucleoside deaminase [Roseiarcus sp.]|jgi:tRNA(Arg) A34 adenosine deaminase TadA
MTTTGERRAPGDGLSEADARFLRLTFTVAQRSLASGNHPFAAILVGRDGAVLLEQENAFLPARDMTAHAERVLMSRASQAYAPAFLASCTLYSSAEPCAMCAGAVYWAGVGRLVYGLGERRLRELTGDHPENPTLDLPCRAVFAAGQRDVAVIGPALEDEAERVHRGAWARAR